MLRLELFDFGKFLSIIGFNNIMARISNFNDRFNQNNVKM